MSDEATSPQFGAEKGPIAGAGLSTDAELVFIEWLASLEYQDVRYHEKVIGLLARQAMIDDDFRRRVLEDPAAALRELGSDLALPEEFSVRFLENTATELNVVLPPRARMITDYFETLVQQQSEASTGLRERLRSRTAARTPTLFQDDWNLGDTGNDINFGMIVPPA